MDETAPVIECEGAFDSPLPFFFFFFSRSYATRFHIDIKARFTNECTISTDIHVSLTLILLYYFWGQNGSFLNWDQQNNLFFLVKVPFLLDKILFMPACLRVNLAMDNGH